MRKLIRLFQNDFKAAPGIASLALLPARRDA
jgi:hypothetical protein